MAMRAILTAALLAGFGCQKCAGAAPPPPPDSVADGPSRSAAGIRWSAPAVWTIEPDRPMRVVTYRVPHAAGENEDAECAVFFFGAGQGGGVEANLARWFGQFVQPDGRPTAEVAGRQKRTINGLPVTTVDVSGTHLFSPAPMSPEKVPKPGWRMLAAIVEAPQGAVFFKLTGPGPGVARAAAGFEAMLTSLGT